MGKDNIKTHIPVLLNESIELLSVKKDGFYIDGTLGEGGHSYEIYKKLIKTGLLLSLDADQEAIAFVENFYMEKLAGSNWVLRNENFSKIDKASEEFKRKPNGILLDLGMSSRQLDISKRGFSYQDDNEPLDMRMDNRLGVKASDLIAVLNKKDLTYILSTYGEERNAYRIASLMKSSKVPVVTVGDLNRLINRAVPAKDFANTQKTARRVYQALRIAVNDELGSLEIALSKSFNLLEKDGMLVVITFHSLEDRIVKSFFEKEESENIGKIITEKPVIPSEKELILNSRAHSAKLRALKKI